MVPHLDPKSRARAGMAGTGMVAILLLHAGSLAPASAPAPLLGATAALMGGVWEVRFRATSHAPDGTRTTERWTAQVPIADLAGDGLLIGSSPRAGGRFLPGTTGVRFAESFSAEGPGLTLTGEVRVDATSGEGTSFRADGWLATEAEITILRLKGRRIAGAGPGPQIAIFEESFEAGLGPYRETDASGALASTLWHEEGFCGFNPAPIPIREELGASAAAYNGGLEGAFTYGTGPAANEGALEGPSLEVPDSATGLELRFDILRGTQGAPATFDRSLVEVREEGCASWTTALEVTAEVGCGSAPLTVTVGEAALQAMVGKRFVHRFRFDTVDGNDNEHLGWYVDNVSIVVVTP